MNKKEWKTKVLKCVNSHCGASFVNLIEEIGSNAKGEYEIVVPQSRNLILWTGLSKELIDTLSALKDKKVIRFRPVSSMVYVMDGQTLSYPVAYEAKDYPVPHWCPVVVEMNPKNE